MVQTDQLMEVDGEAPGDAVTPELQALIDQLIPPPRGGLRSLIGVVLVTVTFLIIAWPTLGTGRGAPLQGSLSYPMSIDEERGLVGVSGSIVAFRGETLQIVALAIDAPGADLVEFELTSRRNESVSLPFEVSQHASLSDAVTLGYTAWLQPVECETSEAWGVVTVTYQDADGDQSQYVTAPYNRFDAIPRRLRPLGADLLTVACGALR